MTVFDAAGLPRLVRMIRTLWDSTDAYRSVYYGEEANRRRVIEEHRAVLDLMRRRDADAVARTLAAHRGHAVTAIEAVLPPS
ncbi:FCD domain-containing protein [Nonomuraea sp. NPDC047897]|uniref:FCD domain-containing protein n=1 Tax=Nonomuraea sp. NPDC047897 TaxID=3364346 RepID=UPI00372284CB